MMIYLANWDSVQTDMQWYTCYIHSEMSENPENTESVK